MYGSAGECSGDNNSLDFIGALKDLHDLGVTKEFFNRILSGISVAAENLDGVKGYLYCAVTAVGLGDCGCFGEIASILVGVDSINDGRPGGFLFDLHVCKFECDGLMGDDRLAKSNTGLGIGSCLIDCSLHDAY